MMTLFIYFQKEGKKQNKTKQNKEPRNIKQSNANFFQGLS